ncbi:SPASM domain-containing protein, partial [bacterium]|nr:SPASM domain-containing protein [bacterium]
LHMLYISLDGHDDESFYHIRGLKNAYQSSHDKVIEFLKLKKDYQSQTRIVLSMIDFQLNEDSVTKTRQYWESFAEVDQFLLKSFSTWDGNASDVSELAKKTDHPENRKLSEKVECPFPFERMTVLWDGAVVPCCNDYDKKLILGDLRKQTLSEIWNGQEMQALRKEFISNMVKNPLCHHCDKLRVPREQIKW